MRGRASAGGAAALRALPIPPTGIQLGPVRYTSAEINAWPSSSTQRTRLASSWGGNNSRTITDWGTAIVQNGDPAEEELRESSVYAVCQAMLGQSAGAGSERNTRWAKVTEVLDGFRDVTSWTGELGQINLVAGWVASNLCTAASIIGYSDPGFETFLRYLVRPITWNIATSAQAVLDFTGNGNWLATFADARLAIASYLQDEDLWNDAKDYFDFRIAQVIYHSAHDGSTVTAMRSGNWPATVTSSVSNSRTVSQWRNALTRTSPPFTAAFTGFGPIEDGTDCEAVRDLSHEAMTISAFVWCARTILAAGDQVSDHAWDRIVAACNWMAERSLHYLENGTLLSPAGTSGSPAGVDGNRFEWCWGAAKNLLGSEASADIDDLIVNSDVIATDPTGYDHQAAPLFGEGIGG